MKHMNIHMMHGGKLMTKTQAEHFMFGLKSYHWKRNDELYSHVQYVLDAMFEDQKHFEESYTNSFEQTVTSSPKGTLQFNTEYLERNIKYDIFVRKTELDINIKDLLSLDT